MSEWIIVKDRFPEDNQLVLLYAKNPYGTDDIYVGYRGRTKFPDGTFGEYEWVAQYPISSTGCVIDEHENLYMKPRKVTHWMPLPEPPK